MPRRSCLTNLIIAERFITDTTDQAEPVDVVNIVFSKALGSVCHCRLVKKIPAMGVHLKITRWMEEFLINRTSTVKLVGHLSREGIVKSGVPQGSVLALLLLLIFINGLADELTCNHLFWQKRAFRRLINSEVYHFVPFPPN